MDGEDAQANEFKERLDQLKAIGDPILFRQLFIYPLLFMHMDE